MFFGSIDYLGLADATDKDLQVNVNVSPVLSLRVEKNGSSISDLVLSLRPLAGGSFIKDDLDVIVSTSNETGYTLTFSDKDTNTNLIHTNTAITDVISSIATLPTTTTPTTEDNFPVNSWGYSLEPMNTGSGSTSNTNQSFFRVPISTTPDTIKTASAPVADDTTKVTFAAKVDTNLAAGTYMDTVVFSATTNYVPKPHSINFNPNTSSYNPATTVTGTDPTPITAKQGEEITLPANPYTRPGYRFLGWDKNANATTATYAAGNTASNIGNEDETIILYAIWQPKNFPTTLTNMQQMTSDICADVYTPTNTATTITATSDANQYFSADNVAQALLTDIRDSKTYVIRKLADGNCWMVKNLDLDLSTSVTLDSTTSDLTAGRTWTPQNSTQTTEGTVWPQNSDDIAHSMDPGSVYFPNGTGTGTADANNNLAGATSGEPWEFIGNYYNWYAATAGTGTAAMVAPATATDSICPKNWKLPDDEGVKSFINLTEVTYGLTGNSTPSASKALQTPLSFVRSGTYYWSLAQVRDKGAHGRWWSSAAAPASDPTVLKADSLYIGSGGAIRYAYAKGYGFTLRCVAR